jgi:hypothetical protein
MVDKRSHVKQRASRQVIHAAAYFARDIGPQFSRGASW